MYIVLNTIVFLFRVSYKFDSTDKNTRDIPTNDKKLYFSGKCVCFFNLRNVFMNKKFHYTFKIILRHYH